MRPSLVHIMPISVTDILICYSNYKSLHIIDSLLGEHLFVSNTREFAANSSTVLQLFIHIVVFRWTSAKPERSPESGVIWTSRRITVGHSPRVRGELDCGELCSPNYFSNPGEQAHRELFAIPRRNARGLRCTPVKVRWVFTQKIWRTVGEL